MAGCWRSNGEERKEVMPEQNFGVSEEFTESRCVKREIDDVPRQCKKKRFKIASELGLHL